MTTQVNFKLEKKLKDQAMKKAQAEGVPFTSVLILATKAYVAGQLELGIIYPSSFNEKTRRELTKALEEADAGKGLSPRFKNGSEMFSYIKKQKA